MCWAFGSNDSCKVIRCCETSISLHAIRSKLWHVTSWFDVSRNLGSFSLHLHKPRHGRTKAKKTPLQALCSAETQLSNEMCAAIGLDQRPSHTVTIFAAKYNCFLSRWISPQIRWWLLLKERVDANHNECNFGRKAAIARQTKNLDAERITTNLQWHTTTSKTVLLAMYNDAARIRSSRCATGLQRIAADRYYTTWNALQRCKSTFNVLERITTNPLRYGFHGGATTVLNISKHSFRLHELWRSLRRATSFCRNKTNNNEPQHHRRFLPIRCGSPQNRDSVIWT